MACTCPYFDDGNNCKHMAAVCFALSKFPQDPKYSPDALLKGAAESDIRGFLTMVFNQNPSLAERFYDWLHPSLSSLDMEKLKGDIFQDINDGAQIHHQCCFERCYFEEAFAAYIEFLQSKLHVYIERGYLNESFELIAYAYEKISSKWRKHNSKYSDSMAYDVMINSLFQLHYPFLSLILEKNQSLELKNQIFSWLCAAVESCVEEDALYDNVAFLQEILTRYYISDTEKRKLLSELQKIASTTKDNRIVTQLLVLMDELHYPLGEIELEEEKYHSSHIVVLRKSERAAAAGNYAQAAKIMAGYLCKSRDDSRFLYLDDDIQEWRNMGEYARLAGNLKLCCESYYKIFSSSKMTIEDFRTYRNLFTLEEWNEEKRAVYEKTHNYWKGNVMVDDGSYSELMDWLDRSGNVRDMRHYEPVLEKMFSDRIAQWYVNKAREEFKYSGLKRKDYLRVAKLLSHALKYESGRIYVEEVLNEWENTYRRKYSLWDILKEEGVM